MTKRPPRRRPNSRVVLHPANQRGWATNAGDDADSHYGRNHVVVGNVDRISPLNQRLEQLTRQHSRAGPRCSETVGSLESDSLPQRPVEEVARFLVGTKTLCRQPPD
jgi:hypothetical protein